MEPEVKSRIIQLCRGAFPTMVLTSFDENQESYYTALAVLASQGKVPEDLLPIVQKEVRTLLKYEPFSKSAKPINVETFARPSLSIGVAKSVGRRAYMEDRDVVSLGEVTGAFVLDGHGGSDCVEHVAKNLFDRIKEIHMTKDVFSIFRDMDCLKTHSGCCLTGVTFSGARVRVYNVGDSRTLVLKDSRIIHSTKDHKPQDELMRHKALGGTVVFGRVDGVLAVSRAFGNAPLVSVVPEPEVVTLDGFDTIVCVCDGVTDVLSNDKIAEIACQGTIDQACHSLVRVSLDEMSSDNLTAIVIRKTVSSYRYLADDKFKYSEYSSFVAGEDFLEWDQ